MDEVDKLENAVAAVIASNKNVTCGVKLHRDDPITVGTSQMADAITENIGKP